MTETIVEEQPVVIEDHIINAPEVITTTEAVNDFGNSTVTVNETGNQTFTVTNDPDIKVGGSYETVRWRMWKQGSNNKIEEPMPPFK